MELILIRQALGHRTAYAYPTQPKILVQRHFGDPDRLGDFIDSRLSLPIIHFGRHGLFLGFGG